MVSLGFKDVLWPRHELMAADGSGWQRQKLKQQNLDT